MSELVKKHSDKLKNLSKDEKDAQLAKVYEQQEKAREKSKLVTQKKKEQNIKRLSIDLHEENIHEFKELMENTKNSKTELLLDMIKVYKQMLHNKQQKQSQQQSQQSLQPPQQSHPQGQQNPQQRR
jgi:hypothetical protein